MTAWTELVGSDPSEEHLELCNRALIEIQNAHAHRLAARLREPLTHAETLAIQAHVPLSEVLASRIDPKEKK